MRLDSVLYSSMTEDTFDSKEESTDDNRDKEKMFGVLNSILSDKADVKVKNFITKQAVGIVKNREAEMMEQIEAQLN